MWIKITDWLNPLSRTLLCATLVLPATSTILLCPMAGASRETLTTPGIIREFPVSLNEIRQAVLAVVGDKIVHGTLVFDKEPTQSTPRHFSNPGKARVRSISKFAKTRSRRGISWSRVTRAPSPFATSSFPLTPPALASKSTPFIRSRGTASFTLPMAPLKKVK